jgi:hypothetical protein
VKILRLELLLFVFIGGVIFGSPEFVYAQTEPKWRWQTGLSLSYLRGDYGQDEDTGVFYSAATIKRYLKKGDLTLVVPYLDISNDGATIIDGEVEPVEGAGGGSGLGDIVLKGRYYAVEQDGLIPFIDMVGSIKFPTADEDEGLGTGKTDYTIMAEFTRRLENKKWIALGELGYTFIGDPSGYNADNRWLYNIGLAYELDPEMTVSGYIDGRTAIFDGNDDPLSLLLAAEYKFRPDIRFDAMLEIGLSDGSPDFGITFGLRKRF